MHRSNETFEILKSINLSSAAMIKCLNVSMTRSSNGLNDQIFQSI